MINLAIDQTAWEKWLDSAWRDADDKPLTLSRQLTLHTHGNHENHTDVLLREPGPAAGQHQVPQVR